MSVLPRNGAAAGRYVLAARGSAIRAAIPWLLIILIVNGYLALADRSSLPSQSLGNGAILLACIYGAVVSARAAIPPSDSRRAWALLALSWFMGALGQVMFTIKASQGGSESSPLLDTFTYLGYSVPVIAALFAFPKPPALRISRFRVVLDALVITVGMIFLSEATVLRPVREAGVESTISGWTGLAYPIADLAICSVVLTFGMLQPPRNRMIWLCLGSGLLLLAVTDSIYVRLLAEGQQDLTGTPLVIGWMAAPLLTAIATKIPPREATAHVRDLTLAAQLIPYVPVWGSIVVLATVEVADDSFLLFSGVLLLLVVTVRQVMIVYENVSLTRDLEAKVSSRTAELASLGSIVTSSSDAIVGLSSDNVITAWNPAAERLFGHAASQVIGQHADLVWPQAVETTSELMNQADRGEDLGGYEINWQRPDGVGIPVALRISPIRDGERVTGISVFGQDITERKQAALALEKAREEALQSARIKSEFLATMSHEIRTPMNGVIGLTTLLLDGELSGVQRRYAEGVRSAGEALLSVINDILDFSKLEAGKVVLDPADFDVADLVEDVGALLAPAAYAKEIELLAYCLPDVPRSLCGDGGRIRQILLNLASNAVKFTPTGEVAIRVKALPGPEGWVRLRFEVSDTGIGIAAGDRDKLFESFSQADATTTRRFGGTGLGLAICRRLVEVMHGEVGVESQLGLGSTFWFELPLPLGRNPVETFDALSPDLLRECRVLVVDDNATNREILHGQLTAWRLQPDLVEGAAAALPLMRSKATQGQPYDLALLDMSMPDVDGLELARLISGDPLLTGTRMMMLTSSLQLEPATLVGAGVTQWLTKPVRSSELYDKLMRLAATTQTDDECSSPGPAQDSARQAWLGQVLVAEDNPPNKLVAEGLLNSLGYQAHIVDNGLEALKALESNSYVAVLMDCHMPVMDGFAATREIRRRHHDGPSIPIIAMTAGAMAEDQERCLAAGMDDYLSKPVNVKDLREKLGLWSQTARSSANIDPARALVPPHGGEVLELEAPIDGSRLEDLADLKTANGSSLLIPIVQSFVDHGPQVFDRLCAAAASPEKKEIETVAHELRGTAGTVGAWRVCELAKAVEGAARHGQPPPSRRQLSELKGELNRALTALAPMLSPDD